MDPRTLFSGRRELRRGTTIVLVAAMVAGFSLVGLASVPHATAAAAPALLPSAYPMLGVLSPTSRGISPSATTCTSTLPAPNGVAYTPAQIHSGYSYSSAQGAGKTIAIIDAYGSGTITSDVACFDATFGLPAPSLSVVKPFGSPHRSNSGWGLETSLDVEWAHAMAPAASILLIITPTSSLTYLVNDAIPYAVSHGANVISMSWGAAESSLGCSTEASEATYFANAASSGVIAVGSSGDSGANDGTTAPTVDYPSADPNVVGVGGTTLTLSGSNSWSSEVTWNDASGASGGGVSACFSAPSYQSSHGIKVTTSSGGSTPTGRAVPDVSYDASPYTGFWVWDTSGYSGWVQVGGTSAGAPQWSAIFADALSAGDANLNGGSVHGLVYGLLGTSNVHDITSGNNGHYYASTGYDACTGVGTPVESSVVTAL